MTGWSVVRWSRGAAAVALMAGLVACGGDAGPTAAARAWLESVAAMDGNRTASLTCDAAQESLMMGTGFLAAAQVLSGQMLGTGADMDVSDVHFKEVSRSGDSATVHASGTMRVAILGVSQGQEMDEDIPMVREDGKWKVCS